MISSQNNTNKLIIFGIISLFFLLSGISANAVEYNPKCAQYQPAKGYYRDFDTEGCISLDDCLPSETSPKVYAIIEDEYLCMNNDSKCPPKQKNKPGYQPRLLIKKSGVTHCVQCQKDKPIYVNRECNSCPENTIFSYVVLPDQTDPCVPLAEIQNSKDLTGIFNLEFNIYYKSDYVCPQYTFKSTITLKLGDTQQIFNKCEKCPLDTPSSQDGVCGQCPEGQMYDEVFGYCMKATEGCQYILSIDQKICYRSTCPIGQFIDESSGKKKCNTCPDKMFLNANKLSCISSCKEENQVAYDKSQACILEKDCEGYYSDTDRNVCLKNTCQRGVATSDLPASIVLPKVEGEKYQVCQACPKGKEFVQVEGSSVLSNECKNCATDYPGMISDFVSGICITEKNIKKYGLLDEEKKNFFAIGRYTCQSGYHPVKKSNSVTEYEQCEKCPSNLPVSDGLICSNTCTGDAIVDLFEGKCQTDPSFKCKGRLSSDGKLCSTTCKPGDKILSETACEKCSDEKPYSSKDFSKCLSKTECFLDYEFQTCFDAQSDCYNKGKNYVYQKDSQICKQGCGENEILTKINGKLVCIDKCKNTQFSYFSEGYEHCQDSCTKSQYAILEQKLCKDKTECTKFITGSPHQQCLDVCYKGEVIIAEKPQDQSYTECVIPTECPTAIVKQLDGSSICTEECYSYVDAETKQCLPKCPGGYYEDYQQSFDKFYYCHKKCPADKLHYLSPLYATRQCIEKYYCTLNISSDKTQCSPDCLKNEVSFQSGRQSTCEVSSTNCDGKKYIYEINNFKVCSDYCKHILLENGKCSGVCPEGEYAQERSQFEPFQKCTKTCDQYKSVNKDGVLQCTSICPNLVSVDKKCVDKCEKDQFITERIDNQIFQLCSVSCDKFTYIDDDNQKHCISTCQGFLYKDTQTCVKQCKPTDFIYEKVEGQMYTECSSMCSAIESIDENGQKLCSKTCSKYISFDKKSCNDSCEEGEFIIEKNEGEEFFQCTKKCPESTFQYIDNFGKKQCIKKCDNYVSADKLTCQNSCAPEEFVNDKNGLSYFQCSKDCKLNIYTERSGIKKCTSVCTEYLAVNGIDCNKSCQGDEYAHDKVNNEIFYRCKTDCPQYEYYSDDNIKRCSFRCPFGQIPYQNQTQNKCFKSKKDCPSAISILGSECIEKCNSNNFEYPKNMNGFKQCFICEGFYKADDQTCSQTCAENEIGIVKRRQCYSQEEGSQICEQYYKYSADKTKCVEKCVYPEIQENRSQCRKPCDPNDTQCSVCPEGQFIFSDRGGITGCQSNCDNMFISSDKKRCVPFCSVLREQKPTEGNICIKCKPDETLILQQTEYVCKQNNDSNNLADKLNTASFLALQYINSDEQFDEMKTFIADISKDMVKETQVSKDKTPKQLIDSFIKIIKTTIKNIQISELALVPHTLGSKDSIIVQVQKAAPGYKFKTNLDVDSIQNGKNQSLTEENLDEQAETLASIVTSIIASNPACKSDVCKAYPLFQLEQIQPQSRMLQAAKEFTVKFNLKDSTDINKYVCLQYDLSNPTNPPVKTQSTISEDKKSISCLVSGSVSIMLDSTCQFIDKSLCPKKEEKSKNGSDTLIDNESEDEELNGGEIAGIVIGVIAFVGITALVLIYVLKIRKSRISKKYEQPKLNQKPNEQLNSEENQPVYTLGVINSEKQL